MLLLKMTRSQKVQDRWYAEFENGDRLPVNTALIADFSLFTGRELTEEELAALKNAAAVHSVRVRAMNILGSRSMSRGCLKERLIEKGEAEERAEDAVEWLSRSGFINDAEYAAMLARHYAQRGYGAAKIRDELYRKKIPREMWEEALSSAPVSEETLDMLIEQKLRGRQPDKKERERLTAFLKRRGFSWDEIRSAVNRCAALTEEYYE